MRISHFVPLRGSRIDVFREILSELGIRNECQLYAVALGRQDHPTLILSAIPPEFWMNAYKLTVNLASRQGTFADAVGLVSSMGINILASWTAATTTTGEGCWTAIVEMPGFLTGEQIGISQARIQNGLSAMGLLSESELYKSGLDLVRLSPLRVLHTLHKLSAHERRYSGHVKNYFIDFKEFCDSAGNSLYEQFIGKYYKNVRQAPDYCLVAPDTEERFIRVTLLPIQSEMLLMSMKVIIDSPRRDFSGYFGSVLQSIRALRLNLYSSDNFLLEKPDPKKDPREVASFAFTVDAEDAHFPTEKSVWKEDIYSRIYNDLVAHADKKGQDERVDLPKSEFAIISALSVFPRCFLATNARKNEMSGRCAIKVMEAIRSLRLQPVNTDITRTVTIEEDVNQLLNACPFVISLHFPVEENRFYDSKGMQIGCKDSHSPSDWVMYEESYAKAQKKRVYRMRHLAIRKPRYAGQEKEFVFTEESFDAELKELIKAIQAYQAMEEYALAVRESDIEAVKISPALLKRNLDEEYKSVY
jgi:hypothetical protein